MVPTEGEVNLNILAFILSCKRELKMSASASSSAITTSYATTLLGKLLVWTNDQEEMMEGIVEAISTTAQGMVIAESIDGSTWIVDVRHESVRIINRASNNV